MKKINEDNLQFLRFLNNVQDANYEQNTTSTGTVTIKQTLRNNIRSEGIEALLADLKWLYGDEFDILRTKEGIVFTLLMNNGELFSWELKSTIKALDFDPYVAADMFASEQEKKISKKESRRLEMEAKELALAAKRQAKLLEQERKQQAYNNVFEERVRKH